MQEEYIQFGCGMCAPANWRNFDAGPAFWLQKYVPVIKPLLLRRGFPDYPTNIEYGDVVRGLPFQSRSVGAVYCSHVLEHLALEEFRITLRNVFDYLRPAGVFRFVVPDLEYLAKEYLASTAADAALHFMQESHLGERHIMRGVRSLPRLLFGRSKQFWMWDYKSISQELAQAGYIKVRRAQFGDSADLHFADVENIGRWENCLGVECSRP